MAHVEEKIISILLMILGAAWVIVAAFNLENDPAWIAVLFTASATVMTGWWVMEQTEGE